MGDSSGAIHQLDQVLEALPTLGVALVGDVPQASVPEAAAFAQPFCVPCRTRRSGRRQRGRAYQSAQALALWSGAEPALASQVSRLRDLAAGR